MQETYQPKVYKCYHPGCGLWNRNVCGHMKCRCVVCINQLPYSCGRTVKSYTFHQKPKGSLSWEKCNPNMYIIEEFTEGTVLKVTANKVDLDTTVSIVHYYWDDATGLFVLLKTYYGKQMGTNQPESFLFRMDSVFRLGKRVEQKIKIKEQFYRPHGNHQASSSVMAGPVGDHQRNVVETTVFKIYFRVIPNQQQQQ